MAFMTGYHGDCRAVEEPYITKGCNAGDFGEGFYCTFIKELAQRKANKFDSKIVSFYDVKSNITNLKIKEFRNFDDEWLDFVVCCRSGKKHEFDVVIGPMVDDQCFDQMYNYMDGIYSRQQFWIMMMHVYPTYQMCFATEEALKCLKFTRFEEVL